MGGLDNSNARKSRLDFPEISHGRPIIEDGYIAGLSSASLYREQASLKIKWPIKRLDEYFHRYFLRINPSAQSSMERSRHIRGTPEPKDDH
jgi:hypothetical protein